MDPRRFRSCNGRGRVPTAAALIAALLIVPGGSAAAQQLPSPFALASRLDLECHRANAPVPPPTGDLWIRQLNPVLQDNLPNQMVELGALEDVCVPVAKNDEIPGEEVLPIASMVDLACYEASAAPVEREVDLSHLNPVLSGLPDETVKLTQLEQLCLPVRKNQAPISDEVRQLVSFFHFACYGLEEPTQDAALPLTLSHLNPVIRDMNLPDRNVRLRRAHQLCVPVAKNNEVVPEPARTLVQWVDFLRYRLTPLTLEAIPAIQAPIPLWLTHLNPLFANAPGFNVVLQAPLKLLVPVAKDGVLPPGAGMAGD